MDISTAITTTAITAHLPHLDTETAMHVIIAVCSVAVVVIRAHQ